MTLVSILSAVFNEEDHIEEMIQSVRNQTHTAWELLVVDDGSNDNTVSLVNSFALADDRIKLVASGIKIGKVAAFNRAFSAASGETIVLLGGDDRLPGDSLATRAEALTQSDPRDLIAAFYKLRTFSLDSKLDGLVIPRGAKVNASGATMALSRGLAELLFPIPEGLVSEDTWLGIAAEDCAQVVHRSEKIVLEYRIHKGNSNPRNQAFEAMTHAMHQRHRAWHELLTQERFELSLRCEVRLHQLWKAEENRFDQRLWTILLAPGLPFIDRLALGSMTTPWTYRLRTRFYRILSGWRGV